MIDLSLLPDGGMGWLDASGPKGSIVLSTRIRLARNLDGYVFGQRAKDADRTAVLTRVEEASGASELLQGAVTIRLDQLERVDRQLPHQRRDRTPGERAYPLAGPRLDEGSREGVAGARSGGADLPGFVRGRQRGRRELLSVIQPDDPGQVGRRAAGSPREDRPPGDRIRGAGARRAVAHGPRRGGRQDVAGIRPA